MLPAYQQCEML